MTFVRESASEYGTTLASQEPEFSGWINTPMDSVRTVDTRDGLSAITDPTTELVIWKRSLPAQFQDWINGTDVAKLPYLRILVRPGDVRLALAPLLDECGLPGDEMRDLLVEDIGDLVEAFADITSSDFVDIRLERVEHDACWKFHRDTVKTRLVTTYRGPTTEWVEMAHAEQAIAEQKNYDGPLERLRDHDVALFKGSCNGPNNGIVHRSPPIAGTGQTRLFLCLNEETFVSPDPWGKV